MMNSDSTSQRLPLAFMLLWNPSGYDWVTGGLEDQVRRLNAGQGSQSNWSVNNFPRRIQPGDRVFMRRTTTAPLGIIGEGIVASDVFWAPSYKDGEDHDLPYVDIDWVALVPSDPLPSSVLAETVKAATHRWASIIYDPEELRTLDAAWEEHLSRTKLNRAGVLPRSTRLAIREERTFQGRFRHLILSTHGALCAVCGLDELSILDAAHIVPHAAGGEPTAENGRPLCANHHRAFDRDLLAWSTELQEFEWVDPDREF